MEAIVQSNKYTSFLSKNTIDQYLTNNLLAISAAVVVASALVLFPELCEAATTDAQKTIKGHAQIEGAYTHIKGLIEGAVGKTIAIVAFVGALFASAFKFNPIAIGGALGTGLAASLGPAAIEAVVGAAF